MPDSTDSLRSSDFVIILSDGPNPTVELEFALVEQRQLLNGCHPKDHRRRSNLASIVEQIGLPSAQVVHNCVVMR